VRIRIKRKEAIRTLEAFSLLIVAGWIATYSLGFALAGSLTSPTPRASKKQYLLVWTGDEDRRASDFLAVVDATPDSAAYGKVLHTIPVGSTGNEPHHVPTEFFPGGRIIANGFLTSREFTFDVSDPVKGRLIHVDEPDGSRTLAYGHSFYERPDGTIVSTYQITARTGTPPGGLVLFDHDGKFMREVSASDPQSPCVTLPYGITGKADIDRLVTGTYSMVPYKDDPLPKENCLQIWRMSDLKLLQTVMLPKSDRGKTVFAYTDGNAMTWEPRFLHGKGNQSVIDTTLQGTLFLCQGVGSKTPKCHLLYDLGDTIAGVPVITKDNHYYVIPLVFQRRIVVLDISDLSRPKEIDSIGFGFDPSNPKRLRSDIGHFIAINKDETRIAFSAYLFDLPQMEMAAGSSRVYMFKFDPRTGHISYDLAFRDENDRSVGLDFGERQTWPHGKTGPARPHGMMFLPQ
jgi:hypothetical protein